MLCDHKLCVLISYPQIMHWKVEFGAGYFQNENVGGATVSNKGKKQHNLACLYQFRRELWSNKRFKHLTSYKVQFVS